MQMDVTPLGEHLVKVRINGRLDTPSVDQLETRFTAALVPGRNSAVVDLSEVDFIASMGIRMLVSTAQALRKSNAILAVYGAGERVSQVFEAASLHRVFPICASEAEALAAVTPAAG